MIRHYSYTLCLLLACLCFERCAQVAPLSGGKRDATPPKLTEAIPANSSLAFNSSEIVLRFDEYVQLKDLKNQMLVSPRLKTEPEINAEGKKIKIILKKEELLPNTTYRIYFGRAIADMTEGNSIPNFEYVFSTGNYIDSLKIKGIVKDAYTGQAVSDVIVGLYNAKGVQTDSLIYKESPAYITRSTAGGEYSFGHLPSQQFKVVAFTDKNKNYTYDGEIEKLGFRDSLLQLNSDTTVDFKIFQENPSKTFIKKYTTPYYGILNVIYNRESFFKVQVLGLVPGGRVTETEQGREKDTVTFVYDGLKDSLAVLIAERDSKHVDTVKVSLPKLNAARKKSLSILPNTYSGILPYNTSFRLSFLNAPDTLKTNLYKIHLFRKDSAWKEEASTFSYEWPLAVVMANPLSEGKNYRIKIDTAAFFDLNGKYNDSMMINFKPESKSELGKVILKLLLNKKQAYVVQLLNDKGQIAKQDFISLSLSSSNAVSIDFTGIAPGTYSVKVVFDDNGNKKWDTGSYLMNKQPEKVFISSKQLKVLPDWEVEEEIQIK
ncbi:MAG: Ig-like domain-containing protein [Bacteroidetes bacterium]|nr:Ig-like domain-containing protein [Bacteroidota bacterium]